MRKFLLSAIALSTAAAGAAPAAAQYYPQSRGYDYPQSRGYDYPQSHGYGYNQYQGGNIRQQLANLSQRIDRSFQRRLINRNEARRLQREVNRVGNLSNRYAYNGISQREQWDLQNRIQNLRQQIRFERQEGRYDRDDRYDDWND